MYIFASSKYLFYLSNVI